MCFGNMRGIREAGRLFAVPTYLFFGSVVVMIIVGLIREVSGHLPVYNVHALHDVIAVGGPSNLVLGATIFTLSSRN